MRTLIPTINDDYTVFQCLYISLQLLPVGEYHSCYVGQLKENTSKNRYKKIFPCRFYNMHASFSFLFFILTRGLFLWMIVTIIAVEKLCSFMYEIKLFYFTPKKRINFITQVNFFYISDDHSRIVLKTGIDYSDYINANYIKVSIVLKFDVINVR